MFICGGLLQSRCLGSRVCSLLQFTRRCEAAAVVAAALVAGSAWAARVVASGPAVDFQQAAVFVERRWALG